MKDLPPPPPSVPSVDSVDEVPSADELASAYLDNDLTAAELAMVEENTEIQAKIDELDAARSAVAAPVSLPSDELKERNINAALDAADWLRAPDAALKTRTRSGIGFSLGTGFRQWLDRDWQPLIAVAMVVLLAAIVGVGVLTGQFGQSDDSFETADATSSDSAASDDAGGFSDMGDSMPEHSMAESLSSATSMPQAFPADDSGISLSDSEQMESDSAESGPDDSSNDEAHPNDADDYADTVNSPQAAISEEMPVEPDAATADLGSFANFDELREVLLKRTFESPTKPLIASDTATSPGLCSAEVKGLAMSIGVSVNSTFTATVGDRSAHVGDIVLGQDDAGNWIAIYATAPLCEVLVDHLGSSATP